MERDEVDICWPNSEMFNVRETSRSRLSHLRPELRVIFEDSEAHSRFKLKHQSETRKIRRRRKPIRIVSEPQENLPSTSTYDPSSNDPVTASSNRRMKTFHKGRVFYTIKRHISERKMRDHYDEPYPHRAALSKGKAHKEKDVIFKSILSTLKKIADKKSEMLQDTLAEETIQLFKSIQIK